MRSFLKVGCMLCALFVWFAVPVLGDVTATLKAGKTLCDEGKPEEALKLYQNEYCQAKSASDKEALDVATADVYFAKLQDWAGAEGAYLKLLAADPKSPNAKEFTFRLGDCYEQTGNYLKAAELYQDVATKFKSGKPELDTMALEGVERCFKKNFKDNIAVLNGQPITRLEFDDELQAVPVFYRSQFETDQGREKFLDQMIERRLLAQAAEKAQVINDPAVLAKVQDARDRTLIQALIDREVKQVTIPDAELKKYYNDHTKDEFKTPAQAKVRWILLRSEPEAQAVLKDLKKKGASWDTIAARRSTDALTAPRGGDLGTLTKGQKGKDFEDAVYSSAFKVGTISSRPVPLNYKWIVFQVVNRKGREVHLRQAVYGDAEQAQNDLKGMTGKEAKFDSLARMRNPDTLLARNGGDLGMKPLASYPKEVQLAVAKAGIGKMTAPVKAYPDWAIFKLESRTPESVKKFEDVKESINGRLLRPKQQERYDSFIAGLKKNAKIEKYLKPVEESAAPKMEEKTEGAKAQPVKNQKGEKKEKGK